MSDIGQTMEYTYEQYIVAEIGGKRVFARYSDDKNEINEQDVVDGAIDIRTLPNGTLLSVKVPVPVEVTAEPEEDLYPREMNQVTIVNLQRDESGVVYGNNCIILSHDEIPVYLRSAIVGYASELYTDEETKESKANLRLKGNMKTGEYYVNIIGRAESKSTGADRVIYVDKFVVTGLTLTAKTDDRYTAIETIHIK